jgi:hypothetical protein
MTVETISLNRSYGGMQGVYKHASRETGTEMAPDFPIVWSISVMLIRS